MSFLSQLGDEMPLHTLHAPRTSASRCIRLFTFTARFGQPHTGFGEKEALYGDSGGRERVIEEAPGVEAVERNAVDVALALVLPVNRSRIGGEHLREPLQAMAAGRRQHTHASAPLSTKLDS